MVNMPQLYIAKSTEFVIPTDTNQSINIPKVFRLVTLPRKALKRVYTNMYTLADENDKLRRANADLQRQLAWKTQQLDDHLEDAAAGLEGLATSVQPVSKKRYIVKTTPLD